MPNNPLPSPPVSVGTDLHDVDHVWIKPDDLIHVINNPSVKVGAVTAKLIISSFRQNPAGSLPSDDPSLQKIAGTLPGHWPVIRRRVLRQFTRCSDGRYYHPVAVAGVNETLRKIAHEFPEHQGENN